MPTRTKPPSRTRKTTKTTKTVKKFVPVTWGEYHDFNTRFSDWLKSEFGKEAARVLTNLEFLNMAAENGVTKKGQPYITQARNQLNKFFSNKK